MTKSRIIRTRSTPGSNCIMEHIIIRNNIQSLSDTMSISLLWLFKNNKLGISVLVHTDIAEALLFKS